MLGGPVRRRDPRALPAGARDLDPAGRRADHPGRRPGRRRAAAHRRGRRRPGHQAATPWPWWSVTAPRCAWACRACSACPTSCSACSARYPTAPGRCSASGTAAGGCRSTTPARSPSRFSATIVRKSFLFGTDHGLCSCHLVRPVGLSPRGGRQPDLDRPLPVRSLRPALQAARLGRGVRRHHRGALHPRTRRPPGPAVPARVLRGQRRGPDRRARAGGRDRGRRRHRPGSPDRRRAGGGPERPPA